MLKKGAFTLLLACVPFVANAGQSVDMSCGASVSEFFAPLVQSRLINTKPARVAQGSVNHFKPKLFAGLNAYGLPVVEVFGYGADPLLFIQRGDEAREVYGVVVRESIANVQAQLNSVGATQAKTFRVDARTTAIACKGEYL
jgi:hypothetical protein